MSISLSRHLPIGCAIFYGYNMMYLIIYCIQPPMDCLHCFFIITKPRWLLLCVFLCPWFRRIIWDCLKPQTRHTSTYEWIFWGCLTAAIFSPVHLACALSQGAPPGFSLDVSGCQGWRLAAVEPGAPQHVREKEGMRGACIANCSNSYFKLSA